jgi:hypothetical protein
MAFIPERNNCFVSLEKRKKKKERGGIEKINWKKEKKRKNKIKYKNT